MASVADAARPVGAAPSPVRHGMCRLTIRIHTTEYRLSPRPPEAGILAAWQLRKLSASHVARYVVTAPKGAPARCTCPDHEQSGWTCKHISALTAAGLIPAPKPASARNRKLHAKNARQAIAIAEASRPAPAPAPARHPIGQALAGQPPIHIAPEDQNEGWQRGGDYAAFKAGFDRAIGAHVAQLRQGTGGYEICDGCGAEFDIQISGDPNFCPSCVEENNS
jgi:SWIM zinc finger